MNQEQMRQHVSRLNHADDIATNIEYLDLYIQCIYDIVVKHHSDEVYSYPKSDAKMILQMMFSKLIHLKKILEGVEFVNREGRTLLKSIIDPTVVTSLVRNIYEQVCLFNIIYDTPDSEEKMKIVYYLWVSAGLKYRQRFETVVTNDENRKKVEMEKEQIEKLKNAIEETQIYKDLDEINKNKIQAKLKEKDYKIKIENGNVRFLSWQDISQEFITKSNMFDKMYTYFSLYAHPSQVSVFQFGEMFRVGDEAFKGLTVFNIRLCLALMSIFLGDYIRAFPEVKVTFENRPEIDQIMLNFYNRMLRGDEKSISDLWQKLG